MAVDGSDHRVKAVTTGSMDKVTGHPSPHTPTPASANRSDGPCSKDYTVHRHNRYDDLLRRRELEILLCGDDV